MLHLLCRFIIVKMSALARKQTFMIKVLIWGREYQKKIN